MKGTIVFCALISSVIGHPFLLYDVQAGALPYVKFLEAPLGPDGRVVDTPEVIAAKAQHEAAQINQSIKLTTEAAKSTSAIPDLTTDVAATVGPTVATSASVSTGAPLGPDGQVVDTPEVAKAKAEHAAAQVTERVKLAQENAKANDQPVVLYPASTVVTAQIPLIPEMLYPPIPAVI